MSPVPARLMRITFLWIATIPAIARAEQILTISPPTNLTAQRGNASVTLSWTASAGAKSYAIYASTTPGSEGRTPVQKGIRQTQAVVSNLVGGWKYYFEVRAVSSTQQSAPSNEASAVPSGALGMAYVVNQSGNEIAQFLIGTDGTLQPLSVPTVNAGPNPQGLTLSPSKRNAYVYDGDFVNNSAVISQFSVGLNGSLVPLSQSQAAIGNFATEQFAIDGSGHHGYAVVCCDINFSDDIMQFDVASDGSLTASTNPLVPTTASLGVMAATKAAVYIPDFNNNAILQYAEDSSGALSPLDAGSTYAYPSPKMLVMHPNRRYAYAVDFGQTTSVPGSIWQFDVNSDGSLAPMSVPEVTSGYESKEMAITPSGQFAYVANASDANHSVIGNIAVYSIDSTGALTLVSTLNSVWYIRHIGIDPTGQYLYVTDSTGAVSQYAIAADGSLSNTNRSQYVADPEQILTR